MMDGNTQTSSTMSVTVTRTCYTSSNGVCFIIRCCLSQHFSSTKKPCGRHNNSALFIPLFIPLQQLKLGLLLQRRRKFSPGFRSLGFNQRTLFLFTFLLGSKMNIFLQWQLVKGVQGGGRIVSLFQKRILFEEI